MPRTMYDSITPSAIPRNAQMVAGYIDGWYEWSAEEWAMFPNAVKVTITSLGWDHGVCLNLEPNGYWPSDLGVGWVRRARARGVDPTIYCNYRNHLALVQAAFDRAGEPRPHFWVAEYNGVQTIPSGCVAKQYAAPEGSGSAKTPGHYDVSIVADNWPGVDKAEEVDVDAQQNAYLVEIWQATSNGVNKPELSVLHRHVNFLGNLLIEKTDTLSRKIDAGLPVALSPEDRLAIVAEVREGLVSEVARAVVAEFKKEGN